MVMLFLLEECNLSCAHCVREDEPMYPGYRLTLGQVDRCVSDCQNLAGVERLHFSGGEPTLWREGRLDFADLLLRVADAGFQPSFITNGVTFADPDRCRRFLRTYVDGATSPLHVHLSVDGFHGNLDLKNRRCPSLDNMVRYRDSLPSDQRDRLGLTVIATISRDPASLLPDKMVEHYRASGVGFAFPPLQPRGKARAFAHLCPDLTSDNPEDLGAYRRFHRPQTAMTRWIVLIDSDYYVTSPASEFHRFARLGHLREDAIQAYLDRGQAAAQ
jgi:MoaA/NifB/PqqE/SkfB family radical SAM enzyme